MNNIKWYYEATSQRQLDELIVFLIDYGYKSKGNNYDDYEQGCFYIGITKDDQTVYCTIAPNEYLIGKRTGDIEEFKAQFNSETELERVQKSLGCEYFVVEKEVSQEFNEYVKWVNDNLFDISKWIDKNGLIWHYLGFDGKGVSASDTIKLLKNNPKQFTASEIMKHINNQMSTEEQIKQLEEQLQELRKKQNEEQFLPLIKDGELVNCYKSGVDYAQRLYTKLGDIKFEHNQHIFINRDSTYKGVLEEDNYGNQIFYITKK